MAEAADCLVIAPATADLLARLVHGEAPDALTALALARRGPLIVCPAMDAEMWRHAATRANVAELRRRGAILVGPESGELASGLSGPGRLAEVPSIVEAVQLAVARGATVSMVAKVPRKGTTGAGSGLAVFTTCTTRPLARS